MEKKLTKKKHENNRTESNEMVSRFVHDNQKAFDAIFSPLSTADRQWTPFIVDINGKIKCAFEFY